MVCLNEYFFLSPSRVVCSRSARSAVCWHNFSTSLFLLWHFRVPLLARARSILMYLLLSNCLPKVEFISLEIYCDFDLHRVWSLVRFALSWTTHSMLSCFFTNNCLWIRGITFFSVIKCQLNIYESIRLCDVWK